MNSIAVGYAIDNTGVDVVGYAIGFVIGFDIGFAIVFAIGYVIDYAFGDSIAHKY